MSKFYACIGDKFFSQGSYSLVAIREEDILLIKDWRNAQLDALRQKEPLTDEGQRRYFDQVIFPTFSLPKPNQILFSFLLNGECIGYGGLVHLAWDDFRAEVSFLLNDQRVLDKKIYQQDFSAYLGLLKEVAFQHLGFNRIFVETYDIRPWHVAVLQESGFELEGRMREHVFINGTFVDSLLHGCLNPNFKK